MPRDRLGLRRGLIEPALFAIMVMMDILTTLMTTPLFIAVYGSAGERAGKRPASAV